MLIIFVNILLIVSHANEVRSVALTDDLGRVVIVPQEPERIISLSPSNTEILFSLGLEGRVVGVTEYCNYPPQIEGLKNGGQLVVVGGYKDPDVEKILSLSPDLVLASEIQSSTAIPILQEAGVPTFAVCSNNISGVLRAIKKVGLITGTDARASELVDSMQSRITAVSEKVDSFQRSRVLFVLWHDPLQTAGNGTVQDEMIEMAGGSNIFHDLAGYPQIDPEAVVQKNPEIIITVEGTGERRDDPLLWAKTDDDIIDTDARENSRIYQAKGDLIARAGPRIVDALEMIAGMIHPEALSALPLVLCIQAMQGGSVVSTDGVSSFCFNPLPQSVRSV